MEKPEPVDYNSMTVAHLKEILQERDLTIGETRNWSLDSKRMTSNWRSSRQDWAMWNRYDDDDDEEILGDLEIEDDDDDDEEILGDLEIEDDDDGRNWMK